MEQLREREIGSSILPLGIFLAQALPTFLLPAGDILLKTQNPVHCLAHPASVHYMTFPDFLTAWDGGTAGRRWNTVAEAVSGVTDFEPRIFRGEWS
jgi:hypothetical protein